MFQTSGVKLNKEANFIDKYFSCVLMYINSYPETVKVLSMFCFSDVDVTSAAVH